LAEIREVFVGDPAGNSQPRRVGVKDFWIDQNRRAQAVFRFEGCTSIPEAEKFRGLHVLLPIEQRVMLPAGQYFVSDLIGCAVFENPTEIPSVTSSPCSLAEAPMMIGKVSDVQFTGEDVSGTPVLVVDTRTGELLIPLAEDICTRIDVVARRIDVSLPEGLRELNERS